MNANIIKKKFVLLFLLCCFIVFSTSPSLKILYKYFEAPHKINDLQEEIDKLESASDKIQLSLTREVFVSDIPDFQKMKLHNLISKISLISDHAEDVGDRVKLLSVKTVF